MYNLNIVGCDQRLQEFLWKVFDALGLSKLHAACYVSRTIFRKIDFLGKIKIRNIFRTGAKYFWSFGEFFSAGLSKLNYTFPEEHFRKILFFEEIVFSHFFWVFRRKNFSFLGKNGKFVKKVILLSGGSF